MTHAVVALTAHTTATAAAILPALLTLAFGLARTLSFQADPLGSAGTRGAIVVRWMLATCLQVATVPGTRIAVVALLQPRGGTHAARTVVAGGARVVVAAVRRIWLEQAPCGRIAGIISADVAVIARQRFPAQALAAAALIVGGTKISVIARIGVGVKDAA